MHLPNTFSKSRQECARLDGAVKFTQSVMLNSGQRRAEHGGGRAATLGCAAGTAGF
jgi:hypothetical protein